MTSFIDGWTASRINEYNEDVIKERDELRRENAKLRELVRIMYYCNLPWKNCDKCVMNGADMDLQVSDIEFCDGLNDLMREIGIEVDV